MQDFFEPNTRTTTPSFLSGGGEMGDLMRTYDWKQTPLGIPEEWPQSLSTSVGILLHSKFPMFLFWGDEAICFYNDAYRPSLGKEGEGKHPCVGKRGKDVWPEIWHIIGPQIDQVMTGGEATWHENQLVPIYRNGKIEDVYWTYSYSPVFNEEGQVAGVYVICTETTQGVNALANFKKSEQELKESKERLQAALDASLTGTFRWNIQTNELVWDENLDRLFGLPPGKTVQSLQSFIERVHPSDRQGVIDRCRRCAEEGADFDMEFRVIWPDGTLHWLDDKGKTFFDEEGKPLYMTGACVDISEHKGSNEALLKSEHRFEAAIHAVQGVLWTNNAKGEMEGEQPGWNALTGQSYEEYQGYGWSKAVHPEDAQPTIDAWNEAVRERKTFVFEHRVKLKNGEWGRFSIRAIPLLSSDGSIREWVGVHTDITKQREAEERLRESEERARNTALHFKLATEGAGVGTWIMYIDDDSLLWSDFQKKMWGYDESRNDLKAKDWHEPILPGDKEATFAELDAAKREKRMYHIDYRIRRANDGAIRWIKAMGQFHYRADGEAHSITGITIDITEQKGIEEALQESERRFRSTFENAAVGVAHVGLDGGWLFINNTISDIVGYPKEELEKLRFQDITHPEDLDADLTYLQKLLAGNISTYQTEKRYIRKDGNIVWVNLTVSLLCNEDGSPKYFVSIIQDISERKKAETALQQTAEKLAHERERLNMALHTGNLGAYEWNEGEKTVWWSPETYEVMGVDKDTFVPTIEAFNNLVHPDDREELWRKTEACMKSGEEFNLEYRVIGDDGKPRWILNRSRTVTDESSGGKNITGIVTDITERKETEEKIRRSERYFRELTDTVPAIIWITRPDGYCTYLNKHWYDYTGQAPEEAEGFGWLNATHPDDKENAERLFIEATQHQKPYYILYRLRHVGGGYRWAIDSGHPKYKDTGEFEGMIGTVIDVHEQKLAEDKIKESEEQFRTLSNAIPQLAWMTDEKGWIYWYNQRWYDYTGTTFEEMQGWGWKKVHHPGMIDGVVERFQKALDAGVDWEDTFLLRSKEGEYRWFLSRAQVLRNPDGSIRGWFGSNTDITEQRNAAQALAESESRFRNLSDHAPMFIFMADENVNISYVNKALLHYLNLQHYSEFTGRTWEQHVHPDDIARMNEVYAKAWQNKSPYQVEIRLMEAATGQYNWFLSIGVPRYEGETFRGFLGTGVNIQAQKELTQGLEQKVKERTVALDTANKELQRSNEDLQQFAHVASHDLKEPVRKVITFQNRLKDELGKGISEKAQTYLQKIEASSLRMYSMIDGVLAYSTLSAANFIPEPVNLDEMLNNIQADLEVPIADKKAIIQYSGLPVVKGSPVLLYQLFYNLIANSLKFARKDVAPLISVIADSYQEEPGENGLQQNKHRIVLQDNGIGFSGADAHRIFQTFTRLNSKDKYEGTGLGLALCKKIVERHSGSIKAEGEVGIGAKFIITLPV